MTTTVSSGPATPPPRIAVIAVHGVGNPPPDETARNVAELLMQRSPPGVEYTWAEERRVIIPTDKAGGERQDQPSVRPSLKRAFTVQAADRTNLCVTDAAEQAGHDPVVEAARHPDIAFTRKLLTGYESQHEPYATVEIVGHRAANGARAADVHVFEMHWGDLTHEKGGVARTMYSIYQLVQHISHLGRKTLDIAAQVARAREILARGADRRLRDAAQRRASPEETARLRSEKERADADARAAGPAAAWSAYAGMHAWAIRVFTILAPVASLLMLTFVLPFIPAALPETWQMPVGVILAGLVLTGVAAWGFYRLVDRRQAANYFVVFMLVVMAAVVTVASRPSGSPRAGMWVLGLTITTIAIAAYVAIVSASDATRPGARTFGIAALALVLVAATVNHLVVMRRFDLPVSEGFRTFGFLGFQWSYALLMLTWGLLWLAVFAAVVARVILRLKVGRDALDYTKRTMWTARVTLASTVFFFIVALLVGYRSFVYLAAKATGSFDVFPRTMPDGELAIAPLAPILPAGFGCGWRVDAECSEVFFLALIGRGGTSGFVLAALGLAVVTALVAWFVVFVGVTAVRPHIAERADSGPLGSWMTNGFTWLRRAGSVLTWTLLLAIVAGVLMDYVPGLGDWVRGRMAWWPWLRDRLAVEWTSEVIGTLTVGVLASAATIGAARLRIGQLANRARPTVGVVLDVDNYLRESPEKATPRARIAERFVSVLRYLERRGGFDRIVLVSHSQGTVITTDLLRFLTLGLPEGHPDRELVRQDRVRLLTMGSPLRQLYGSNFPQLYGWVAETNPIHTAAAPPVSGVPDIASRSPDPAALRVERWVNLYTSGDYIGRNLWSDDHWTDLWEPRAEPLVGGARRERCLGAGTHTRYWVSPEVAEEVDELISAPSIPSLGTASGALTPH